MIVFISWSGEQSRLTAEALADWLPSLIQGVRPWVSSRNIRAGSRWALELPKKLDKADFGVLCVTRQNQVSPWLLYEAGALSNALRRGLVVPYLLDLAPSDLIGPLSQFQAVEANAHGTQALMDAIVNAIPVNERPPTTLGELLKATWPHLESRLALQREQGRPIVTTEDTARVNATPPEIQEEIESAEKSEAIGDVWAASETYWSLTRTLEKLGLVDLQKKWNVEEKDWMP